MAQLLSELIFVELLTPLVLNQEVAFEDTFNHEVVFFVSSLKEVLLHDRQLGLIYSNQARLSLCYCHFLSYL